MAEIINLDKLRLKLDSFTQLDIEKALNKSCLAVENEAKKQCPVDTGDLRNSITHEVEDNVGYVGTNKEYAPYVHQGTGIYAVNGDGRKTPWTYYDERTQQFYTTVGQLPNPFLTAALQNQQNEIIKIVNDAVKDHLDD